MAAVEGFSATATTSPWRTAVIEDRRSAQMAKSANDLKSSVRCTEEESEPVLAELIFKTLRVERSKNGEKNHRTIIRSVEKTKRSTFGHLDNGTSMKTIGENVRRLRYVFVRASIFDIGTRSSKLADGTRQSSEQNKNVDTSIS